MSHNDKKRRERVIGTYEKTYPARNAATTATATTTNGEVGNGVETFAADEGNTTRERKKRGRSCRF
jgi:hypothetical protein